MPESIEPVCYDPEAARTILPWEIRYMELRLQGASDEERERKLAEEVGKGELVMPSRTAMSYMMSSSPHLFDPESGRDAGNWKPHIMLYMPGATSESIGLSETTSSIMVARPGTPMSHLIIVVPEFIDPSSD